MNLGVELVVVAMALVAAQQWLRLAPQALVWAFFIVSPLTATFVSGAEANAQMRLTNSPVLFAWVKLYLICLAGVWAACLRSISLQSRPWASPATKALLAVNILVAVIQDVADRSWPNLFDAAAGGLLICTIPRPLTEKCGCGRPLPSDDRRRCRIWICAYTAWNWTFVYLNFPVIAGQQAAVLASSLIVGFVSPQLWLMARTYTLAVWFVAVFSFPSQLVPSLDTSEWRTPTGAMVAAATSLALAIVSAAFVRSFGLAKVPPRRISTIPYRLTSAAHQ